VWPIFRGFQKKVIIKVEAAMRKVELQGSELGETEELSDYCA
jgi:hypothetical protein